MSPTQEARFERLRDFVAERGRGRWLVLTHDNPDPDALASAVVLTRVLRALHQRATPAYGGIIGRAENREMVRTLQLKLSHVRHISWRGYQHFALVDTQPRTGNNQLPDEVVPEIVFDHHPRRVATKAVPFQDIRPRYGATATLAAEYLLASGRRVTHHEATALVYAIRTETRDFSREASGPDRRVHDQLLPKVRQSDLARIQYPRLPLSYFATLHQALERLEGADNLILSHLGEVAQPDIVPEIADLLLRLQGKTWSLCTGIYRDRIYLSVRTSNTRADAGRLMRRVVGHKGRGGGHGMTAGGWIESASEPAAQQRRLGERLARALRKDPQRLAPIHLTPHGWTRGADGDAEPSR
ncbi:MAG TPA: DHHA1 domain-containing protein [Thermoanaerobaculia bacterium]|nr:DHHA1 domain-containing protein [Thermoanaerobaculia bacterium]